MFNLELCVTDKCNLGCPYCYSKNKNTFMTMEVFEKNIHKLYDLMERAHEQQYDVSFFGGEPLMNWKFIKQVTPYFKNDPKCHSMVLISNLVLIDREKVDFLKENGIGVSWSFDGKDSDISRPLLNGKSVMELYKRKKDLIFELTNGCHTVIYPENGSQMKENLQWFYDFGISNPGFALARDDVWSKDDIEAFRKSMHEATDWWIDMTKKGERTSGGWFPLHFMDMFAGFKYSKRPFICFAGTNGAAFSPDGKFYACQRFASEGEFEYNKEHDFQKFMEEHSPKNYEKCKKCKLYFMCYVGCTYSTMKNNNQPIDGVCELFHIIYDETCRALRELKHDKTFQEMLRHWNNFTKKVSKPKKMGKPNTPLENLSDLLEAFYESNPD